VFVVLCLVFIFIANIYVICVLMETERKRDYKMCISKCGEEEKEKKKCINYAQVDSCKLWFIFKKTVFNLYLLSERCLYNIILYIDKTPSKVMIERYKLVEAS
jgi:hypothetical protein